MMQSVSRKALIRAFAAVALPALLGGCTIIDQQDTAANAQPHGSVLPATVICFMAACDAQFADRSQRAGDDAKDAGTISAEQTATAVPSVVIPLTGASPAAVVGAADAFLHGEEGGDGSLLQEAVDAEANDDDSGQ